MYWAVHHLRAAWYWQLTNGVVTSEAVAGQHSLNTGDPVIHTQGSGEVLHHCLVPVIRECTAGKAIKLRFGLEWKQPAT